MAGEIDGDNVMPRGKVRHNLFHMAAIAAPAVHEDKRPVATRAGLVKC